MPSITTLDQFPLLRSARLTLNQPNFADMAALFEILSDATTADSLNVEQLIHMDAAAQILRTWRNEFRHRQSLRWALRISGRKKLIGTAGYRHFTGREAELGFVLSMAERKKGYMYEALNTIIYYGFEKLGLEKISAYVLNQNKPSLELLEKLGFVVGKDGLADDLLTYVYLLKSCAR